VTIGRRTKGAVGYAANVYLLFAGKDKFAANPWAVEKSSVRRRDRKFREGGDHRFTELEISIFREPAEERFYDSFKEGTP
jgi:hypothetical protein